jgi:nucleoside-diphosphate-sugar epimerase
VFNVASGRETRIGDVARWVNEITENPAGIEYTARRNWDTHSRRWASIRKAGEILGYEPRTELYDGLVKTVRWFRTHWATIAAKVETESIPEPAAEVTQAVGR